MFKYNTSCNTVKIYKNRCELSFVEMIQLLHAHVFKKKTLHEKLTIHWKKKIPF